MHGHLCDGGEFGRVNKNTNTEYNEIGVLL